MDKADIATVFDTLATLLELRGDNPFKIRAYQSAARTLETMPEERRGGHVRPEAGGVLEWPPSPFR